MKREKLIEALMRIREGLCAYGAPHNKPCDCKSGVAEGPRVKGKFPRGSENGSGCPELYVAIGLLQKMTDEEYKFHQHCKVDDGERVTAGELKDRGVAVPIGVPDQAWVHRKSVQAQAVLTDPDEGSGDMFAAEVQVTFTEPFRWFEPKPAGETICIPCLGDDE